MSPAIRPATPHDADAIHALHLRAFPEPESTIVAKLAVDLLHEAAAPGTFALVAEVDGGLVGHVAFSPVTCDADPGWRGCLLAPLGVDPAFHRQGVGSLLVRAGIERLAASGVDALFVYGDPAYYGRFGFTAEAAARYAAPYPLAYPFGWQGLVLRDGGSTEGDVTLSCVAPLRDPALW